MDGLQDDQNSNSGDMGMDQPITSVDQSALAYLGKHRWQVFICLALTAVIEIAGVILFPSASFGSNRGSNFALILLPLFIPVIAYGYVKKRIHDEFMRQFAEANGYTFSPYGSFEGLDGTLFRLGNGNRSLSDLVSGQYLGSSISLFNYQYQTGSGKNRITYYYTVFELQFNASMPDFLLEKNISFSSDKLLGRLPEQIKLEGDFDKYFSLSIKKGYEVEALEIFTPDVMAALEEKCKDLSLEIINNHLFIYSDKIVDKKTDLDALYGVAQYFVQTLGPVLARMKGSVEAMEAVQSAPN